VLVQETESNLKENHVVSLRYVLLRGMIEYPVKNTQSQSQKIEDNNIYKRSNEDASFVNKFLFQTWTWLHFRDSFIPIKIGKNALHCWALLSV